MSANDGPVDFGALAAAAETAIRGATSTEELAAAESAILGKRSGLAGAHRSLGGLEPDDRRTVGATLHGLRGRIEQLVEDRRRELAAGERVAALEADRMDLTEVVVADVASPLLRGHKHLVTTTRDALEDVFLAMGFNVAEGREAETDWYNFEALNMPPAHPARGMYDTMYLDIGEPETVLLRTHTSPVQIHLMEEAVRNDTLPIHAVMPGKCYRLDTPDARHLPVFNQIEGLVVDRDVTFGDLAGTIQTFTTAYFGEGMQSRLRPAYFPFTEPSAEFEITCAICRGAGCRTCSNVGWVELGGCGMVDPAVFAAVGIDSDVWSGFAFGFGIDRLALMRHEIPDLRSFMENDIRFLSQF